jgi:3-methyladenine DNA glycosylase/8-oxoguanine DNA glycosylase
VSRAGQATARIVPNGPLDPEATFGVLAGHAVPGAELADAARRRFTRLLRTAAGTAVLTIEIGADAVGLTTDASGLGPAVAATRHWLDLDQDLVAVDDTLAADPLLAEITERRPGIRVVGHPDGFEAAVSVVLGQQVSLAAGRTFGGRLVAAYGSPGPGGLRRFPAPERLAARPEVDLRQRIGVTGARARTLRAVAGLFAEGFVLAPGVDAAAARRALAGLPGIGPWTVEYLALRVLGDRDACPAGDLVLRRALGGISAAEVARRAEGWRPWRAYAVSRLWTAVTQQVVTP